MCLSVVYDKKVLKRLSKFFNNTFLIFYVFLELVKKYIIVDLLREERFDIEI